MNEILKRLAEKAGLSHMPSNYSDMRDLYKCSDLELEYFAELVVMETLGELCYQLNRHDIDMSNLPAWYKCIEKTEEYFR